MTSAPEICKTSRPDRIETWPLQSHSSSAPFSVPPELIEIVAIAIVEWIVVFGSHRFDLNLIKHWGFGGVASLGMAVKSSWARALMGSKRAPSSAANASRWRSNSASSSSSVSEISASLTSSTVHLTASNAVLIFSSRSDPM
jgi:hypothetical protein